MLVDSMNVGVLAENVRYLDKEIKRVESELPPDYSSTEEVNTHQKWVDGKDIYIKYIAGTFPVISETSTQNLDTDFEAETIVDADLFVKYSATSILKLMYNLSYSSYNKILSANSVTTVVSEKPYYVIVKYIKPDPTP